MAKKSRRNEMLGVALEIFAARGFAATSIGDLAKATGLSKAAFSYHFSDKDEILVELAMPLLERLEEVVAKRAPAATNEDRLALLDDYLGALLDHRLVAVWMDGDKSVASHPTVGRRLKANNRRMSELLSLGDGRAARVRASALLGSMWRPIRNLPEIDVAAYRRELTTAALEGLEPGG